MVVGELSERTDVAVIGGGPGGYTAALRLANRGRRVTLIERDAIGGVCLNVGCIPSKTLIHQAELRHLQRTSHETGISVTTAVDPALMVRHRRDVVRRLTSGVEQLVGSAGVDRWHGSAHFVRADRLVVEGPEDVRHLEFEHCVIATGSRPIIPPGWDRPHVIDSTDALHLDHVPGALVVVGGGYIGVELGTAFAKLGSTVSIIEMADRVLPGMDSSLSAAVTRRLGHLGVTVHTGATVERIDAAAVVVRSADGASAPVVADRVIAAVGRRPNTDELNLAAVGIEIQSDGRIRVGPDRRAAGRIYAIGDVTPGPALAHKASAEAAVAAEAITGRRAAFDALVPEVVFSDPEVGSVGETEASARAVDPDARAFSFPYRAGSRAPTLGDDQGFVRLVADGEGTIIGAQLAGRGVSELMAEVTLAIELGATVTDVAATIHAHPTMSEAIAEAAFGLAGDPLHVRRPPT